MRTTADIVEGHKLLLDSYIDLCLRYEAALILLAQHGCWYTTEAEPSDPTTCTCSSCIARRAMEGV